MIPLHYDPGTASMIAQLLLQEPGTPFGLRLARPATQRVMAAENFTAPFV